MNAPDPLSFCVSTLALADIGCKYKSAHEEIGVYRDIIKSTSDLVAEIKDKLQKPVAGHLPSDDKAWIYSKVQQAEVLLAKANKVMKGMDKVVPRKRFRWVFQKRGVAETYKGAIFQCHVTLSQIRSSLIQLQRQRYRESMSWMEADALPQSRQIANTPWQGGTSDDNHWGSSTLRRTLPAPRGYHSFPSPYPSRRISRAAITGRAIPLAVRNTDLQPWLLSNILQRYR